MTKLQNSVLIVLALFALFSQTYGEELKYCSKDMVFDGKCPLGTSRFTCLEEFLDRFEASAMPTRCRCQDLPSHKRKCTCDIVCGV
ncbi:hypothetical protein PHAVU_008G023300 [Phaseolus vulgaris]|uniref:Uncharacterized protein n=1 Tax=Phaseolus vulgaris TaxID=3885 RepID=V7B0L9_PHAVU|nr:hypothetical protein PHAVU_008G023300g [Phaseolus vulgaris]ESW11359.1 hypothetical protein PHAVU_008G023300g [Phaseolus vulgaris]